MIISKIIMLMKHINCNYELWCTVSIIIIIYEYYYATNMSRFLIFKLDDDDEGKLLVIS